MNQNKGLRLSFALLMIASVLIIGLIVVKFGGQKPTEKPRTADSVQATESEVTTQVGVKWQEKQVIPPADTVQDQSNGLITLALSPTFRVQLPSEEDQKKAWTMNEQFKKMHGLSTNQR